MAFTDAEKTDIRRFAGYGLYGGGQPLPASGYRFSTAYGTLEYKMNTLGAAEEAVARVYLTNLNALENDIMGSAGVRTNLDTAQAAVWTHNKNELRDRRNLFNVTRREFCGFFGVPPGPNLGDGGISLVV